MRETDILREIYTESYPWCPNCPENFTVSVLLMEVSKCWKMVQFPKIQSKWNLKLFCEAQTMSHLKEITQISLTHQIKTSNISGTKIFLQKFTRIYRHLLSECFENPVRRHLEMVQCKCFFLTPTRNTFAGKFGKWVSFLTVLREYTFYNDEWVKFC